MELTVPCLRTEASHGRGDAIEAALIDEYFACFSKTELTQKQNNALVYCMKPAVTLAHSTVMPLMYQEAVEHINEMNPIVRAVCALFFKYLMSSWFSIENPKIEETFRELRRNDQLNKWH